MSSTFRLSIGVPKQITVRGRSSDRESFYAWAWKALAGFGLLGVHEGTLLSEQAAAEGLETESWTIDAGQAPRERDWVAGLSTEPAELYFATRKGAEDAAVRLAAETAGLQLGAVSEQKAEDWDADWKASFTGAQVKPFWQVLPPWREPVARAGSGPGGPPDVVLRVNPGAGFGTGTHETTQLCLEAIGNLLGRSNRRPAGVPELRVLDFGSGSGILAIGAALLGARVDAVEIDPLAIDNARENARMNGIEERITYSEAMGDLSEKPYDVVIANILKPVLLEFADALVARLAPGGSVILSGLMEPDGAPVAARFSALLGGVEPERRAQGEWRALIWKKRGRAHLL